MNNTISINWKVTSVLKNTPPIYNDNIVFNLSPNIGLFSQFSLPLNLSYVPQFMEPTVVFHNAIKKLLKEKLAITVKEKKFPYKINLPILRNESLFKLQIRLFLPNIVSVSVNLIISEEISDIDFLIKCQDVTNKKPISNILQWTIGMIETLDHINFDPNQRFISKPALHLDGISTDEEFQEHFNNNISDYVGILIRNNSKRNMGKEIPSRIIQKNNEHNLKSAYEKLLIDKQGILYLTSKEFKKKNITASKLSKCFDLYEIANVIGLFMENYLQIRCNNEDFADFLLYKIRPWIEKPEVIFRNSKSNQHIWALLINEFELRGLIELISEPDIIDSVSEKSKYFNKWALEWWNYKEIGSLISRKLDLSRNVQFNFLSNTDLKNLIIEDYYEAISSLHSKNYKSTILLCGSIAEAILIDILISNNPSSINQLLKYTLSEATEAVKSLINNKELLSLLTPLRNFRNLIHPGVQVRKSLIPDESIAKIAMETLNLLIKELN